MTMASPPQASSRFATPAGAFIRCRRDAWRRDFFFHDQIYRSDGEEVLLPVGKYRVSYTRGPEYRVLEREIEVADASPRTEKLRLKRWINLADIGCILAIIMCTRPVAPIIRRPRRASHPPI